MATAGLLAVPVLAAAAPSAGPDRDRLPQAPRCSDAGSVTRLGAWVSVRGPRFVERPLGGDQTIAAYVVSPHDQDRVFATNGTSIVGSTDAGCTWRELYVLPDVPTDENPMSVAGTRISVLVVPEHPRSADRVLAVANETAGEGRPHVLISEDGTPDSFERREDGLPAGGFATDLAVAPTNPDFVWLSVRLSPTTGPGGSGLPALPPLPDVPGLPPTATPDDPTQARGALYASVDGGQSWTARVDADDPFTSTSGIDDLVTDPLAANQLWAVAGGVLRHSADAGRTFRAAVPSPSEQRARGWRVTAVVVAAAPGRTRTVTAFSATSAQGGGPRVLTSVDGGATFDEVPGPGPVDSAQLVGPDLTTLAVSTAPHEGQRAGVHVRTASGSFEDLTPVTSQVGFALSTDRTPRATLHARLPEALLRYVGPAVTPPPPTRPAIGAVVDDEDLPPLGTGAFTPARDVVELTTGTSRTVPHVIDLPRRGTPLDLFVLVDTTLSMRDDLPALAGDVMRLVRGLRDQGVDVRVGLGEFKGQESSVGYRRVLGIGPSLREFEAALSTLNGDGSGLEMQLIALEQALDGEGEGPGALAPAPCKATDGNPDRYVLDERRTTPPVTAGQQADFAPSHAKALLIATDTTFLRPAGTRLTPDCQVDVAPVARAYAARGIHVLGLGIDDVDNPRTAEDLTTMAVGTRTLQPAGQSCAPGLTEGRGPHAAVCRTATGLQPTLVSIVERQSEPARVTLRETTGSRAVSLPRLPSADLRRPRPVPAALTYTCGDEAGETSGTVEAVVAGLTTGVVARLPWTLRCLPAPPDAVPPVVTGAFPPVVGTLPLPAPVPPPAPPAQVVQPQVQTQPQANPQVQAGTQEDQQQQVDLALALQAGQRLDDEVEYAMSARAPVVPPPVFVAALAAVSTGAAGLALRRQRREREALHHRLVTAR